MIGKVSGMHVGRFSTKVEITISHEYDEDEKIGKLEDRKVTATLEVDVKNPTEFKMNDSVSFEVLKTDDGLVVDKLKKDVYATYRELVSFTLSKQKDIILTKIGRERLE